MSTAPARQASTILAELVNGKGKHAKLGLKLRTSRDHNWLLALVLNTYAKVADGAPLNDLDAIIVKAFESEGMEADLTEHGRLYASMSATDRRELFPGAFARLPKDADYTVADLARDLPALEKAVLAMPNALDIDVVGVHEGRVHRGNLPRPSRRVSREYAGELLRAVEPDDPRRDLPPTDPFRIKATSFHCTDETGIDWTGSDEPYWIFGAVGNGVSVTSRSQTFGDIDSGDTKDFGPGEGWIWGLNNTPQPLPEGEIGALIQLWEHDSGDPKKTQDAVAAAFAVAAGVLAISGVAAWVSAVVAGVGAVVKWLLGFMDDDHIGDQTFVFTRQTLLDQAAKQGSSFDTTRRFTDGDGDYTCTITATHTAPPSPTVTVPDVREMQVTQAATRVRSAGLVPKVIGVNSTKAFVTTQSPSAGTSAARGSTVNLRTKVGPLD
jgi:hypothetical protein